MGGPSSAQVVCAACGRSVAIDQADIVTFGTGYRCQSCSGIAEVDAELRAAKDHDRQQRGSDFAPAFQASAAQVRAEVEAIRRHPVPPGEVKMPTPEQIESVIQSDEDTAVETEWRMGRPDRAPPPGREASPSPPPSPRYVCIVCFRAAADQPGECPHDHVPLSDLTNPEAADALREHVRGMANRREGRRFGIALTLSLVIALTACVMEGWSFDRRGPGAWIAFGAFLLLWGGSRVLVRPIRVRNRLPDLLAASGVAACYSPPP